MCLTLSGQIPLKPSPLLFHHGHLGVERVEGSLPVVEAVVQLPVLLGFGLQVSFQPGKDIASQLLNFLLIS